MLRTKIHTIDFCCMATEGPVDQGELVKNRAEIASVFIL